MLYDEDAVKEDKEKQKNCRFVHSYNDNVVSNDWTILYIQHPNTKGILFNDKQLHGNDNDYIYGIMDQRSWLSSER